MTDSKQMCDCEGKLVKAVEQFMLSYAKHLEATPENTLMTPDRMVRDFREFVERRAQTSRLHIDQLMMQPSSSLKRIQRFCEAFSALTCIDVMRLSDELSSTHEARSKEFSDSTTVMAQAMVDVLLVDEQLGDEE